MSSSARRREVEVYQALSSNSRLDIYRLLMKGPKSVEDLSNATKLSSMTVRHHVKALEKVGLVESHEERGRVGKPRVYYGVARNPPIMTFPVRHYMQVLDTTVTHLKSYMPPNELEVFFKKVGLSTGLQIVKSLEATLGIKDWTLKEFKEAYVDRFLVETGAEPEVVSYNGELTFRIHNCPVQELASKDPGVYCDIIEYSMHEGIREGTKNKIEATRLHCIGHGDPYCELTCRAVSN